MLRGNAASTSPPPPLRLTACVPDAVAPAGWRDDAQSGPCRSSGTVCRLPLEVLQAADGDGMDYPEHWDARKDGWKTNRPTGSQLATLPTRLRGTGPAPLLRWSHLREEVNNATPTAPFMSMLRKINWRRRPVFRQLAKNVGQHPAGAHGARPQMRAGGKLA
uniref:Uncharacterized protein n=1 Tax=Trichuris muris TaxID=70415 RepID=A0A5S6QCQ7_TRIMR